MSPDDRVPDDSTPPTDPLLETALAITDDAPVDWERLRRERPDDARAVRSLEALSAIAAAHGAEVPGAEAPADEPPQFRWGRLEARRRIGDGSSGEIWAAWDPGLEREVALKLRRGGDGTRRSWLNEARRLAQVRHPNVVTVYGADEHDGRAGLWMDRLHGRTLEDLLAVLGPASAREAAAIGVDLCAALAAVHAASLVHGDVKMRNVMREGVPGHSGGAGRIVLMDFGSTRESSARGAEVTYGTPLFTAPEVLGGGRPTAASDLYALGVVLYRLVTGGYPVEAASLAELRGKLERSEVAPLRARRPDLPAGFVAVVECALATDPARRFADAAAMERALQGVLGVEAVPRRSQRGLRRIAGLAAALAVIALAATAVIGPRWARPWLERPSDADLPSLLAARDWIGSDVSGVFGLAIENLGDWNGDGIPDFAVGAPGERGDRGRVHIVLGADTSASAARILEGGADGDRFGASLAAADLDGDGHPDLVVGAPDANDDAGRVSIHWGGPDRGSRPPLVLEARRTGQSFGFQVDGAGDVDEDGTADLLVGAPTDDEGGLNAGRAYLYRGGRAMDAEPDLVLSLGVEGGQLGGRVRGLGDFNADGHADFALGAPYAPEPAARAGRVLVYFGGPGLDATPDLVLRGEGADDFFGDLWAGGDIDGDGHPDLVVGALRADGMAPESGCAYIFFGGADVDARADLVLRGESPAAYFGRWCEASADFDGDGFADVIVGAPGQGASTDSSGAVYLFRGGPNLDDVPDLVLRGGSTRSGFGGSPTAIGDVRGDGLPDLVVGSPIDSRGGKLAGSVRLFDGARFHLFRPRPHEIWGAGRPAVVEWTGAARAEVAWSADGGQRWTRAFAQAGGAAVNSVTLAIPATLGGSDSLRVRITAANRRLAGRPAEAAVRLRPAP